MHANTTHNHNSFMTLLLGLQDLCVRYWPQEMNTPAERGPVTTELLSEERFEDYIHREIKITESFKVRSQNDA